VTAYTSLESLLRLELRESSANAWTADQLATYLSRSEQWLAQMLSQLRGSGRFLYSDQVTLAASAETLDMTSAFTKTNVTAIRTIDVLDSGNVWVPCYPIAEGDENLYRTSNALPMSQGGSRMFYLEDTDIHILPVSTSSATLRVRYAWAPVVKGIGGTSETPSQYDDILVHRAAFDALAVLGQTEMSFEKKYATRLSEIEDFEVNRVNKGTSETIKNVTSRFLFRSR